MLAKADHLAFRGTLALSSRRRSCSANGQILSFSAGYDLRLPLCFCGSFVAGFGILLF